MVKKLRASEAAEILGVSDRRVRQMIATGALAAEQTVSGYLISAEAVRALATARAEALGERDRSTVRDMATAILQELRELRAGRDRADEAISTLRRERERLTADLLDEIRALRKEVEALRHELRHGPERAAS